MSAASVRKKNDRGRDAIHRITPIHERSGANLVNAHVVTLILRLPKGDQLAPYLLHRARG